MWAANALTVEGAHLHCWVHETAPRRERAAVRLHKLVRTGLTPRAVREPKCANCSLLELCMPDAMAEKRSARAYLERVLDDC